MRFLCTSKTYFCNLAYYKMRQIVSDQAVTLYRPWCLVPAEVINTVPFSCLMAPNTR